jgi:hypothetical protein
MARVRKARRSSILGCGHWVTIGNLIASRDGKTWICLDCALAAIRAVSETDLDRKEPR